MLNELLPINKNYAGKFKILAISGSTRERSSNLYLIKAIAKLTSEIFTVSIFNGLTDIPAFNPDLDNEHPPLEVVNFRLQLKEADGILICTPEYAMGVPGTLKNAIDWTVSSMEFSKKPVALITASLSGEKAHASLLETLSVIESKMTADTKFIISFVKTKVNDEAIITDNETLEKVNRLTMALADMINTKEEVKDI